jgi:hypothetical protein
MYFIPTGLLIKYHGAGAFWTLKAVTDAGMAPEKLAGLTCANFIFKNLLPVTIGNIIDGSLMVGLVYWLAYLRTRPEVPAPSVASAAPGQLAASRK